MKYEPIVVWLEDVGIEDVPMVGGKGASLGEMINAEIPVPRGFCVTAQAFRHFIDETNIANDIFSALHVNVDDTADLTRAADTAKQLVLVTRMPQNIRDEIAKAYAELTKRRVRKLLSL